MRVTIAGSRGITDYNLIEEAVKQSGFNITTVVSGGAKGVDSLGEQWAKGHNIPIVRYPAQWGIYGMGAGYRRNVTMAENADALIAIWDGKSKGTEHMLNTAVAKELKYWYTIINPTKKKL